MRAFYDLVPVMLFVFGCVLSFMCGMEARSMQHDILSAIGDCADTDELLDLREWLLLSADASDSSPDVAQWLLRCANSIDQLIMESR